MQQKKDLYSASDPRDIVIRRLARELARYPEFTFSPLPLELLEPRDKRLAQAIYAECTRRLLTLEFLLNTKLSRPIDELEIRLRTALIVGAGQIFFFDHLPDHAVVDQTVSWAGRFVRPKAKGLVNAVLRKMIALRGERSAAAGAALLCCESSGQPQYLPLSGGGGLELTEKILPTNRIERWAWQTSHPPTVVADWLKRFGSEETRTLLLHNLILPPIILTGEFSGTDDSALAAHADARFRIWTGAHAELVDFLECHPGVRVQDPASVAICESTAALDLVGKIIVDACAGSGTKTAQLALLHPAATVIATDVDERRRGLLTSRFEGHPTVTVIEPAHLGDYARRAGLLVLDLPCSNTGVLARRIEAKYRVDAEHLDSLVNLQRQIIADTLNCRSENGLLLYGTCSLEPIENERQLEWLERWHQVKRISEGSVFPAGQPGGNPANYHDGGYHALLM